MDKISPVLLRDTLNLIQLARETARLQGIDNQAEKLEPVVDKLKGLVENKPAEPTTLQSSSPGILGQSDFELLLSASRSESKTNTTQEVNDRNRMVQAMVAGGMGEIEVARQLGISRGEVKTIISLQQGKAIGWS